MYVFDVVEVPEYFVKEGFAVVQMFDMPGLYMIAHIASQRCLVDELESQRVATILCNEMVRLAHSCTSSLRTYASVQGILEGRFGHAPWDLFGTTMDCRTKWLLAVKMAGGKAWF